MNSSLLHGSFHPVGVRRKLYLIFQNQATVWTNDNEAFGTNLTENVKHLSVLFKTTELTWELLLGHMMSHDHGHCSALTKLKHITHT